MKKTFTTVLFLLITSHSWAQVTYKDRIEFELKDAYNQEKVIAFGADGLIMTSQNKEPIGDKTEWKYTAYDSSLKEIQTTKLLISKGYRSIETYNTDNSTHTLYKDRKGNYTLASVKAQSLETTEVSGNIPKKTRIHDMAIHKDYAFFNACTKKREKIKWQPMHLP